MSCSALSLRARQRWEKIKRENKRAEEGLKKEERLN